ncbi:heavy metal-associated domain-containing protein [Aurantimonas sp. 22II-16-19i]|uniref:heavy-metal-associated domain-containing protein n=1 Tax=Aurantimonas sp. 22II-16-19i TaxID=1317114 RepID=UPI0009F7CAC8|nr:heavy metal-associated domain-containing protein [Aurantimonas sp. 22II-16-19i]ORE90743.1 Putative heavy metal transporting ATPase [Aurantimonas sp. 22II-16-19i]
MSAVTNESRFRVTGMDCAACGNKVDTAIRRLPGVEDVAVSVSAGTVRVSHVYRFDGTSVVRQVRNLGYGAEAAEDRAAEDNYAKSDDHAGHKQVNTSQARLPWWRGTVGNSVWGGRLNIVRPWPV